MNLVIVADSSGLISLATVSDQNHTRAEQILANPPLRGTIIVPSDVFSETLNITGKKSGHVQAMLVADLIVRSETFLVQEADIQTRNSALALFRTQPESVSFTDCMVMAMAQSFSTKHIFGFDEVFKKNGFVRVGIDE